MKKEKLPVALVTVIVVLIVIIDRYFSIEPSLVTAIATVCLAVITYWYVRELRLQSEEREREHTFSIFLGLLEYCHRIIEMREKKYIDIQGRNFAKEVWSKDDEVLDYFRRRLSSENIGQEMEWREYIVLEIEIVSMNILNELCRYAFMDDRIALILKAQYFSRMLYYEKHHEGLPKLLKKAKTNVKGKKSFPEPQFNHIRRFLEKHKKGSEY